MSTDELPNNAVITKKTAWMSCVFCTLQRAENPNVRGRMTMSNGNLVRTPFSEIGATIELLSSLGVTAEDLVNFRKANSWQQDVTSRVLKGDDILLALLMLEVSANKCGLKPADLSAVVHRPEEMAKVVAFLRGKADIIMKKPFWRRIRTGGTYSDEWFEERLNTGVFVLKDDARSILDSRVFRMMKETEEVDFAILSPRDLGFTGSVSRGFLSEEAMLAVSGVKPCRFEDGVHLRLAYLDQPNNELVYVLTPSTDIPHLFFLERNDQRMILGCERCLVGDCFSVDTKILFRCL